ncbi:hypothetical protein QTO34_007981, partial [Cnephaeus nilssonii]
MPSFIEKYHPDKAVANHAIYLFYDNAVSHFRQVLKCRQKQTSLDRFLVRQRPKSPSPLSPQTPTASPRRRKNLTWQLPNRPGLAQGSEVGEAPATAAALTAQALARLVAELSSPCGNALTTRGSSCVEHLPLVAHSICLLFSMALDEEGQ